MSNFVLANFINTTLAADAGSGATSITLSSSTGLPSLTVGQTFPLVLNDAATGLVYEVVYATAISGAVCTVTRAQEGTSAQNWQTGDRVFCAPTAGSVQTYTAPSISTIALTNINVTLTLTQYSPKIIKLTGTLTGNVNIYFPSVVGSWTVTNACTGAYTVTLLTTAGGSTGQVIPNSSSDIYYSDGTNINYGVTPGITQAQGDVRYAPLRNFFSGFNLTTTGGTTSQAIGAGQAADSTNAIMMTLATNYTKTTSTWTVGTGNGGLDAGSISANTKYYFFVIQRPDTGVVDIIFSTSSSAPTLPTNYVYYRYIGMNMTDGSSHWLPLTQPSGSREFYWGGTPPLDFSGAGSTTARLLTCSLPVGRKVKAFFNIATAPDNDVAYVYFSDPDNTDLAPSTTSSPLSSGAYAYPIASLGAGGSQANCWTNTSGQVRHREHATDSLYVVTLGWYDPA